MGRIYSLILLSAMMAAGCPGQPQPEQPKSIPTQDFNFPLYIKIDVPDVPERLLRPSPPIQEPSKEPAKEPAKEPSKEPAKGSA